MNLLVIGAGAWGTALAVHAAQKHEVLLWTRTAEQAATLCAQRTNQRYLPGVEFPASLNPIHTDVNELRELAAQADLVVVGTPMAGLRSTLTQLHHVHRPVIWICKGFEAPQGAGQSGLMGHEVCAEAAPAVQAGVLSGPSFALELARGLPTAVVAASPHAQVRAAMIEAFHFEALRVYDNADWVGVEVGGAVKNVLAIATGLCDGLQLGLNARAALITRGLAEMARLGVALGADRDTFMGLSGLGDLVLTATGELSRNRKVGLLLAQGLSAEQAVQSLGHVAEGVYSARTVAKRAESAGVDMPITRAVVALLDARITPAQAVAQLMSRDPTREVIKT